MHFYCGGCRQKCSVTQPEGVVARLTTFLALRSRELSLEGNGDELTYLHVAQAPLVVMDLVAEYCRGYRRAALSCWPVDRDTTADNK